MVDRPSLNRSQKLLCLLEGTETFIINVRASDDTAALEKVIANRKTVKGAEQLLRKDRIIRFYDKLNRPMGKLIDLIDYILKKDPEIRSADSDAAGVIQLSPGDWCFFGVGRT
jgi:hypothetical protein